MTLKYSTGLRDKMHGLKATVIGAVIGTGITFVDGGGSDDTITDSGNGFITAGFAPGQVLFVQGSSNNDGMSGTVLTGVAAGTLTMATGSVVVGEAGVAGTVLACAQGGSLKDIMKDGVLYVFSGSQPTDPDDAVSATLLMTVTESAGSWSAGAFNNGLEFEDDPTDGVIEKASGETWQGVCSTSGIAGWFMFCANPTDARGASTTLPRITGSIGTANADAIMPSTSLTSGKTYTLDNLAFTRPMYYGA